jgi:hypothetical protein
MLASRLLCFLAFSVPGVALAAEGAEPAPPPPPPPPATEEATALQGFRGSASLGGVALLSSETEGLGVLRLGGDYWWRNVSFHFGFHIGTNTTDTYIGGGELGMRLLASSTNTGPYLGAGFEVLAIDLSNGSAGGLRGKESGMASYIEGGAIVRGRFFAGMRFDVPFFGVSGTVSNAHADASPERHVVYPLSVQLGLIF